MPEKTRDKTHPVWDVYDALRTARLTVKYHCTRLDALERQNFTLELLLAATTTGSAIAAMSLWEAEIGKVLWQGLLMASAIVAVAKPFLRLGDKIKTLSEIIAGWRLIDHQLHKIEIGVRETGEYGPDLRKAFAAIMASMDGLVTKSVENTVKSRIRSRCQQEVRGELPDTHFFVPER